MARPRITTAQLKQWRKDIGATQAETAQALGFSWRTVTGWEIEEHPDPAGGCRSTAPGSHTDP